MVNILKQSKLNIAHYEYPNGLIPVVVTYNDKSVAKLTMSDSSEIESSCLNCKDMNCIKRENTVIVFEELQSSQSDKICPTDAIGMTDSGEVRVDRELCIGCGLCISACPIGAIYLDSKFKAVVNYNLSNISITKSAVTLTEDIFTYKNPAIIENDKIFSNIISSISSLISKTNTINRLVCKSLQLAGVETYFTRQGDINIRMDGIGLVDKKFVLIEAELTANLDSPRDILDDVAVFCSRYNIKKENTIGAIVLPELPNKRTEFWELLTDIKSVVDVNISVIPLSVLLMIVWNRKKLALNDFYLDKNLMSAREKLTKVIGRKPNISEPSNLIEAAK
ncbi:4Fe-4S binding protein [Aliikangiella sp. IMCC44653]